MVSPLTCFALFLGSVVHPVFPPKYDQDDVTSLKGYVAEAMKRSPEDLYHLVPVASGIYFIGCPNCHGGAQENGVFEYSLDMGDTVKCRYCGMVFPNERFPNNRELVITGPATGVTQVYRWHETPEGRQHFFEAHAWWHRWRWTQDMALYLANLYALTGDPAYGDRAAAIVGRFGQVYADYPIRFDYPYKNKQFFPANQKYPYGDVGPYRGAKFYWWAYADIPDDLIRAYDLLAAGDCLERMSGLLGSDIRARIENDMIRMSFDFTAANPDSYSNMSPGMYHDMITAGRVIGDPAMVKEAVERFRTLMARNFFADGWWYEGTPSYHAQTVGNLIRVAKVARGYTAPEDSVGLKDLDLEKEVPLLSKAIEIGRLGVLPDGRMIPINDTWSTQKVRPLDASVPRLWPALGHAVLGAGTGETQFQAHLNWSGAFGHSHADNATLIVYAFGKELVSDIGYTHTRYRNWTVNTASHNGVVVDERSQFMGNRDHPSTGNLRRFDVQNERVRLVDLDATPAYPQCSVYRRRLLHIHVDEGKDYLVDVFDVEGGATHDWFLHGSADECGTLALSVDLNRIVPSLVPAWGGTKDYVSELDTDVEGTTHHAYGFLWNVTTGPAPRKITATWQYEGAGLRTHVLTDTGAEVYRFVSPAIRGAKEVDASLPTFLRHGFMLRHTGGRSRFLAVHEPFSRRPTLDVEEQGHSALVVRYDGVEDTFRIEPERVRVTSSRGWTYDSGEPLSGAVTSVHRDEGFALRLDRAVPSTTQVRLTFGGTRSTVYSVAAVDGERLNLADDPGFDYDPATGRTTFRSFPQEVFDGGLNYTVFP